MPNTTGDDALTKIIRETNSFHDFVQVQKKRFWPFLRFAGICS